MSDERDPLMVANESIGPCSGGPCVEAQEHIWELLDGELTGDMCTRIEEHLADCGPCRRLRDDEQQLKDAIHRACGCESVPSDVRSRVLTFMQNMCSDTANSQAPSRQN